MAHGNERMGSFTVRTTISTEYSMFDDLPRELRDRLNSARIKIIATTVLPHYHEHGLWKTLEALDRLEEMQLEELRFSDSVALVSVAHDFTAAIRAAAFRR